MRKTKIFLIFLITFLSIGYIFLNLDYNVKTDNYTGKEKNENKIENKISSSKPVNKTSNKVSKKNKNVSSKLKVKDILKNILTGNKKSTKKVSKKDKKISYIRNIFKKYVEVKKIVKKKVKKSKVDKGKKIADIIKKVKVNFVLISDYDTLAFINGKKYRKGQILDIDGFNLKVKDINEKFVDFISDSGEIRIKVK